MGEFCPYYSDPEPTKKDIIRVIVVMLFVFVMITAGIIGIIFE